MSSSWALLPVKRFEQAKQRLMPVLDDSQRRALFAALVNDLLDELLACDALDGILVVSGEPAAATQLAQRRGVHFLAEQPACLGLNQAVAGGLQHLADIGATRALVLHGDLPLVDSRQIAMALGEGAGVWLTSDWRGEGTNAMSLPLPNVINPGYGPGSFHYHRDACAAAAVDCHPVLHSSLAFDVDTPQDLGLLARLHRCGWGGQRARGVVSEITAQTLDLAELASVEQFSTLCAALALVNKECH